MIDNTNTSESPNNAKLIALWAGALTLPALLHIPENARGMVILTHGIEGSADGSHKTALTIAQLLYQEALATLVVDLFTTEEQQLDQGTDYFRLNTSIMEQRIMGLAESLLNNEETKNLSIGYFGAGATGAAVLIAAAERPDIVAAVVSAGGYIDKAQEYLRRIIDPTLLIASQQDESAVRMGQSALEQLTVDKQFEQVPGVRLLFETQESVARVAQLAAQWFTKYLVPIL